MTSFSISSRINLTIDEDFKEILLLLKRQFPLLKEIELIKMAVSGYYVDHFEELSLEEKKFLDKSKLQLKQKKYGVIKKSQKVDVNKIVLN